MVEQNQKEVWFIRTGATRGFNNFRETLRYRLWKYFGSILFSITFDPFNFIRIWILKAFGAKIGKNTYISRKATFVLPWLIKVGDNCGFDEFSYVNGCLIMGNNVSISSFVKIVTAGHDVRSRSFDWTVEKRIIKNGAFVGANSFVLGSGTIGTFSVVGANSFVIKDIPENVIACGNPCRIINKRVDSIEFEKYTFD